MSRWQPSSPQQPSKPTVPQLHSPTARLLHPGDVSRRPGRWCRALINSCRNWSKGRMKKLLSLCASGTVLVGTPAGTPIKIKTTTCRCPRKQGCQTCNNSVEALASGATYLGAPAEHSGVRGRGVGGAPRGRGEEGQQQATRAHPHQLDARPASRRPPWQSPLQLLVRAGHDAALRCGSRGWRGWCCRGPGAGNSRGGGPPGPPPSTARVAGRSWSRTVPSTGGRGQRSTSTQSISVSGPRPPRPPPPFPDQPLEALAPPIAALLPENEQLAFPPSRVLRAEWALAACPSRPIQPRPPFPAFSRERRRPFYPPTFQA
ncbi:hypothetical protein E2C01_086567 [Portunus trituberculatus]|uniref:Uncharacterized protein n=1 Tax=Portunus trituberculatus TaxID=210409 RepID=A0A5B7JGQ0_PORTR|nr:hypothetical protein [Portunus trituberculatus]